MDRYATLSGQVSELLDSFALADGGAYAVAQIWLEEQVADGMPGVADYPCLEGRVESVSYAGLYGAYEVYSFDYSLYTDRPDLVEEERSVDVGSDGWVSRPYSVSGLAAYLLLEGDEVVSVVYSDSSPLLPGFWYTCGTIPREERYELAARVAYDQAYSLEQLYLGSPPWDQERVFTREELEGAGYAAETLPGSLGGGRQSTPGSRRRSISETHFNPISRNAWPRAGWMPCSRGRMPPISFMRRSCISGMMCPAGRAMTPIL